MTLEKFYDGLFERAQGQGSFAFNGWGSRRSQFRRYEVVRHDCGIASGDSVLDWGCGTGDLYWYLHDHGVDVSYLGVDVVPEMIRLAKENKVIDARLHSVLDHPFPRKTFDHVICIGTVGAMQEAEQERWLVVQQMLNVGLLMARKSMAITFLTTRDGPKKDDGYHWYQQFPLVMMQMAARVPSDCGLMVRADYHPHDMTVIIKHNSY